MRQNSNRDEIQGIKTWSELLTFITKDFYKLPKKKVAQEVIGIAEKSYFDIIGGKIPKERLIRQISGFVKENYNAELNLGKGNNISIKRSINIEGNNNVVKDSQSKYIESKSDSKQKEYLLNRVIELEDEVKKLKVKRK